MSRIPSIADSLLSRIARNAIVVLVMTSVHHAYGAYIYQTPWRLHVVLIAVLAAGAISTSLLVLKKQATGIASMVSFWIFSIVTLVIPVLMVGLFEGGYNHTLKNALYFSGMPLRVMRLLFPEPTYELPNDLFFEITGVLQVVPAIVTARQLWLLIRNRRCPQTRPREASAAA